MKTLQHMLIAFTFFITGFSQLAYSNVVPCDISNYEDFIYNHNLMEQHVRQYQTGCNLQNAKLIDEDLIGVNLKKANLKNASLLLANLSRAWMIRVDLSGAEMQSANLTEANLSFSILKGTNLKNTNLRAVNFEGANLEGANLRGIRVSTGIFFWYDKTNFKGATYSSTTQFDEDFSPEEHGMIKTGL